MSAEKILDKASFLKGVEVGRALRRWAGGASEPIPEPVTGPFQMKVNMQKYGLTEFVADMRGTFEIDWGDGVSETISNAGSGGITHDYPALGEYVITIDEGITYLGQGSWTQNGLRAVTELLSPLPASLKTISYAFSQCNELTSIPSDLFSRCTVLKTVKGCFSKSPVTTIPSGLFDNCVSVTSFESCFANCTRLTAIPAGLFDNCLKVTAFNNCFLGCSLITAIPAGLFDGCPEALTFTSCFKSCKKLTTIPGQLFQNQAKAYSFSSCFASCVKLVSLPADLFEGCVAAANFDSCFESCQKLESISEELFAQCTQAEDLRYCFWDCAALADVPDGIFDNNTAITQLDQCFMSCILLSHAPALWVSFPHASHSDCFYGCSNADNYSAIPSSWK